ncbi:MAG: hydantoinase/oxoprolinase family protein [Candidatus Rokubacteria bacterium]|nr:hydantoinase/oxoprolinase family protein [Candidatus Rokubacteria bacterium]MBI3107343.1 hydantoinase/oxoprolinase family protein [Candidatus Rokubacteria bacterium]
MAKLLGIDVGGTFTDLFYLDEATGRVGISKASTTPQDLSVGLFNAMAHIGVSAAEIDLFIHGTTIATNAIIERKGARCGLITTRGFRDVLELGRRDRPHLYGLHGVQEPLVPRDLRLEVGERMSHRGEVVEPLDESGVLRAGEVLRARGVDAVVVCFLHSYANPAHERRAGELLQALDPRWTVSLSSELLPEFYEFERFSTATVHAFLQPMVARYVGALKERLAGAGFHRDVLFVQSNGGIMSSATACQRPANLARSGPAAGVTAASYVARLAGFDNVISADMGGTSFDVCLIPGGRPHTSDETQLDFRLPLRVSMIDVHTIGAGGGSIAWIDRAGILQVGPESAGADPGPAAYGRGGTRPTVTDANLVLGRIDPGFVLGGQHGMRMDPDAAARAIEAEVGKPLGLGLEEAATAIIRVANNNMAGRIRMVSVERGYDPRDFALVAFGGAGPLHAAALMRDVGIGRSIIPYYPGVLCALGCVTADVRHDFARTVMRSLDDLDPAGFRAMVEESVADGVRLIQEEGVPVERVDVLLAADMAYEGQRHNIRVSLPAELTREAIAAAFAEAYRAEYKQTLAGLPVRLTTLRVTVLGVRPRLDIAGWVAGAAGGTQPPKGRRRAYFDGRYHDTPVYARAALSPGSEVPGPAIVEQEDCTTVLEPDTTARVDRLGNLILEARQR